MSPSALIGSLLLSKITPTRSSSSPTKYGGYPSSILEDVFESITTIGGSTTESQSSSSPGAAATSYEGTGDKDPLAHGFIYAAYDVVYPLRWDFLLTALLWIERFWICSIIYPISFVMKSFDACFGLFSFVLDRLIFSSQLCLFLRPILLLFVDFGSVRLVIYYAVMI